MRLLHTEWLEFKEFFDDTPNYTILSHRWTDEEVSFEQFLAGERKAGYGYRKLIKLCEISRTNGYEWTWIDTCCIDKRSSAELTEAINSMYKWYESSDVCYAFLPDVHHCSGERELQFSNAPDVEPVNAWQDHIRYRKMVGPIRHIESGRIRSQDSDTSFYEEQFKWSEWFERGWTLQELLAPPVLVFFNTSFEAIGSRDHLRELVSTATGIEPEVICEASRNLRDTPFAEKMRWVSKRKTSRSEDRVYCLLGLLDISISMLYGEGERNAFLRLQKEFLNKSTGDGSIFVWDRGIYGSTLSIHSSIYSPPILARNPLDFDTYIDNYSLLGSSSLVNLNNIGVEVDIDILGSLQLSRNILWKLPCQHYWYEDAYGELHQCSLYMVLRIREGLPLSASVDPQLHSVYKIEEEYLQGKRQAVLADIFDAGRQHQFEDHWIWWDRFGNLQAPSIPARLREWRRQHQNWWTLFDPRFWWTSTVRMRITIRYQ